MPNVISFLKKEYYDNNVITDPSNCHINYRDLKFQKCYIHKRSQKNII